MVKQDIQGEGVLVQVAVEYQLAVDVAGLSRLEDRRISFLVKDYHIVSCRVRVQAEMALSRESRAGGGAPTSNKCPLARLIS